MLGADCCARLEERNASVSVESGKWSMHVPNGDELIDVRPDERFDEARLVEFLRGRLPGTGESLSVRQFGGGKANLTYLLRYGADHEYVLRRPPLGPYAPKRA